jgi:hypothetical protein
MLPGGSRSRGTIACLVASFVLNAKWVLVAAFVAVFVFSSPLSAACSSRKAPRISITKAKAVWTASETLSSNCRAAHRRVTQRPTPHSISSRSHDDPQPIVRPLRC